MAHKYGIVIVGGGLAAARTAEQLRRADYGGPLTLISNEAHLPYDRPPLSKDALRTPDRNVADIALKPREFYDENDITLRLGSAAVNLDVTAQAVALEDQSVIEYEDLIVATGLVPKRIPSLPDLDGIRVLRSIEDSIGVREDAGSARHAVVIGGGFIGCEVAASLRQLGIDVAIVEAQSTLLGSVLGEQVGALVTRMHESEGVRVLCGVGVTSVDGESRVEKVLLSDGTELQADLVVIGIGSHPVTGWLEGSGIDIDNGVVCDGAGRTSAPHVWALGDVAAWRGEQGHHVRAEHWSNVAEQVRVLVPALLAQDTEPAPATVPYFWSDQYDVKIQCLGKTAPDDAVHIIEDDGRKFLAFYERDGALSAVCGGGMPGRVLKARSMIANFTPITDLVS